MRGNAIHKFMIAAAAALVTAGHVNAQPYKIAAKRGLSAGDEFRQAGSVTSERRRSVTATPGPAQPDLDVTTSLEYALYVQVTDVNDGAPTRIRCTVTRLILDDGKTKRSLIGAPPDVTAHLDDKGFTKIEVASGTASEEALAALYDVIKLEPRSVRPGHLVSSSQPRNVGDRWAVNPKLAADLLWEQRLDVQPDRLSATARLVSVETASGDTKLTVALEVSAENVSLAGVVPDFMRLTDTGVKAHYTLVVPLDEAKPIRRMTSERTVTYVGEGNQSGVTVKADHFARMTESWTRTLVGD